MKNTTNPMDAHNTEIRMTIPHRESRKMYRRGWKVSHRSSTKSTSSVGICGQFERI